MARLASRAGPTLTTTPAAATTTTTVFRGACWRDDQGGGEPVRREPRPEPGTPPESIVAGLVRVRTDIAALRLSIEALAVRSRR